MRPDQLARMRDLEEKLVDQFLMEADPAEWPGAGLAPCDMSKDDRGDQYWCKKNAAATLAIVTRAQMAVNAETAGKPTGGSGDRGDDEGDLEAEQKKAEQDAQSLINQMRRHHRADVAP